MLSTLAPRALAVAECARLQKTPDAFVPIALKDPALPCKRGPAPAPWGWLHGAGRVGNSAWANRRIQMHVQVDCGFRVQSSGDRQMESGWTCIFIPETLQEHESRTRAAPDLCHSFAVINKSTTTSAKKTPGNTHHALNSTSLGHQSSQKFAEKVHHVGTKWCGAERRIRNEKK